jgi:hypothetical protein
MNGSVPPAISLFLLYVELLGGAVPDVRESSARLLGVGGGKDI